MKSEATIIGVKQISQLYFLTKDLKASLCGKQTLLTTEPEEHRGKRQSYLQYISFSLQKSRVLGDTLALDLE